MKLQDLLICSIAFAIVAGCSGKNTEEVAVDTTLPEHEEQSEVSETLAPPAVTREKVSDTVSSECIGDWGYLVNPETDISFSVSISQDGKFEIAFSDYSSVKGEWFLAQTEHHRLIMQGQDALYDERFTIEDCEVGKPNFTIPADEYVAERKFVLEKFGGDIWSEAANRGIEIIE